MEEKTAVLQTDQSSSSVALPPEKNNAYKAAQAYRKEKEEIP